MKRFNPSLLSIRKSELHQRPRPTPENRGTESCNLYQLSYGPRHQGSQRSAFVSLSAERRRYLREMSWQADYMSPFKIPSDQVAKFKTSVHAKPCTTNRIYPRRPATTVMAITARLLRHRFGRERVRAMSCTPGRSVSNKSAQGRFRSAGLAECVTCHSNHDIATPTDQMIGTQQGALCVWCHSNERQRFLSAAGHMRSRIDEPIASIDKSNEILSLAERKGMEVSKPKFELKGATDALTHARVDSFSSSTTELDKVVGPGFGVASKGYQAGLDALAELSFRRKGLAISLVFVLFLALLVYLKVRQIESRQAMGK